MKDSNQDALGIQHEVENKTFKHIHEKLEVYLSLVISGNPILVVHLSRKWDNFDTKLLCGWLVMFMKTGQICPRKDSIRVWRWFKNYFRSD